ncbi:hypothetical protein XFF6166_820001 [Xanthomonas citri pv. fuscans]|nr:hypothetical protein XFF6166_820001 [Xanthomonas citri pv. fuscans]SOO01612.1 hypothetical protein XFF6960_500001 [Xanthomonas citri pv. fuscans]SOO06256.1 hypothetical protein XFF7767_690001 [Xanthomonas citri pv. fuscans]SOO13181.1 hypothetical protein XFF7766_130001 [Xanthomonas citri pv. fuscans]SOO45386.1 hypothetical protein XFF1815_800013 [Xanthomonas citri pv. fuscans]
MHAIESELRSGSLGQKTCQIWSGRWEQNPTHSNPLIFLVFRQIKRPQKRYLKRYLKLPEPT